ncbi:diguanylate cyclase [Sorangium sp. So ce1153]|uniref:diguanylate cyclase n=1 Tax=Sorangium sp. So ce1153 TaxID=3133333 RepID=UPI003F5EF40F
MRNDLDEERSTTQPTQGQPGGGIKDAGTDCLVVIYTTEPVLLGKRFVLKDNPTTVGRGANNHIVLDGESVSRRHAHFEQRPSAWMVVDDGSTNGTYCNDEQISREVVLKNGDRVKIGPTIFKFLSGADVESQYHEEIYRMTIIDGLTQIHNKRYLHEAIEREIIRNRRHERGLAILLFDIDHFKRINDVHGHLAGDFVLKEVARLVHSRLRRYEVFARYGGDTFAIVLPEGSIDDAAALGETLRQQLAEHHFVFQINSIRVTLSIGLALLQQGDRAGDLIKRADESLYAAKRSGRNCVVSASGFDYRRLLDGPSLLEKALTRAPPGSLIAFELEDEREIVERLGSRVYDHWFRQLVRHVELTLGKEDELATWRDRYVLAAIPAESAETTAEMIARVRAAWSTHPTEEAHRAVAREIRSASLNPSAVVLHQERSLDVLVSRLLPRPQEGLPAEDELPFPIAALRAMVASRRTTLGRVKSLLDGIETALRFVVAVGLGVIREVNDPALEKRAADVLAGVHGNQTFWGNVGLQLGELLAHQPRGEISEAARALVQSTANNSPLAMELFWTAELCRSIRYETGISEDAHGSDENRVRNILDTIIVALHPLGKLRLVSVAQLEDVDNGSFSYSLYLHRGAGEHFPIVREHLNSPLQKGWCYLLTSDRERPPICLAPIVLSHTCNICRRVEVAVAERLTLGPKGAGITVRGVTTNHEGRVEVPSLKWMQALHDAIFKTDAKERCPDVEVTREHLIEPGRLHPERASIPERPRGMLRPPRSPQPDAVSSAVRRKLRTLCSYVSIDDKMLDRLVVHLRPLEQENLIEVWHERMISPGSDWDKEVHRHVEESDIIIFMVSADFIASERSFERVVRRALERHDAGQAAVVPILLRPCILSSTPLAKLKALPRSGIPVASCADPEKVWAEVADELRQFIIART